MQLIRTSFNLRSDIPWNKVYRECIYAWIGSLKDSRAGKKLYEGLLQKLPKELDLKENSAKKYEFAGDKLEYHSFTWKKIEYIGFIFTARNGSTGRIWKTQIALKRTEAHVLCFVSQDCDLGQDRNVPKIERPYIIDLLTKLQDGDGIIGIKPQAHILEPFEISKAKNALTGKMRNVLPIVYLSCSERTLSLKPNVLAGNLFGIAHVFAEKDSSLKDRLAQEFQNQRIPQGGEIGICYAGQPITIFNRHDSIDWVEKPETLVQHIFLKILKTNLSLKFNFTWDDFLSAREDYENGLLEEERIKKINTIDEMRKEWLEAQKQSQSMSNLVEKILKDLEKVTQERDQYKEDHVKYDSLSKKLTNCEDELKTWKELATDIDKDLKKKDEEYRELCAKHQTLQFNLNSKKDKNAQYLPLLQPIEKEMYPNEYVCQMVRVLNLALKNVPTTKRSPKTRTKQFIEDILANNTEAKRIFDEYDQKKCELERIAAQEELSSNGAKVLKFFHMETETKGNHHVKIRFTNDSQERFIGTEASTGSDKAHGGKNEASDISKALLW